MLRRVGWWQRLRDADRRAIERVADGERHDTGEGWQLLTVAAAVFGAGAIIFFVTGAWPVGVPAALGAALLSDIAVRKYLRSRPPD